MGQQVSFVRQLPPQSARQAVPLEPPIPFETFHMGDPPRVQRSAYKPIHRNTRIMKLAASCDPDNVGITDTTFEMLHREKNTGTVVVTDLLGGEGIIPAGEDYMEWYLWPQPAVYRRTTRLAVNVTAVGNGVTGLIFEFLFTQQGLT